MYEFVAGPKETLDQLHRLFEKADNEQYTYLGINSTEFCFPEDMHAGFQWPLARVGQTVAPQTLCLIEPTGLPLRRRCIGNRIYGGYWEQLNGTAFQCATNVRTETLKLYNYQTNPIQHEAVAEILTDLIGVIDSTAALVPADVFYLSKTIENIKSTLFNENSNNGTVFGNKRESLYSRLSAILNRVMYVNESILLNSQVALNATNILLDATDAIINQISVTNSTTAEDGSIGGNNSNPVGVEHGDNKIDRMINLNGSLLYRTGRLVLLIADPAVANVTGIALLKDVQYYGDTEEPVPAGTDSFDEYQIRLITADESEEDIMEEENLEIASYIPSTLLENIKLLAETEDANNTKQLRVVITVFFNDHIFKEVTNGSVSKANSKVISITLPGFGSDLPGELPIFFRDTDVNKSSNCGYWDFNVNEIEAMPQWSYKRCYMVQQDHDLSLCKCSHLTSFSRLCMDMQYVESTGVSQKFIGDQGNIVLDVITAIGCTLSLLGVGGIFITAIIFPNWRSTANSKVLLQLSLAIAIEMFIVFLEGPDIERDKESNPVSQTKLARDPRSDLIQECNLQTHYLFMDFKVVYDSINRVRL
ncbi:uncharacterized protein LOC128732451 [Sabethes cyaneus]|uniref:uncharacterized protein LOC128732451 n=1 Tax=Sabethes cyaneus TaxID=53552 RepID=UPI00237D7DED|nr:uncharacterized protein LOC128732451 [Sabethes cyaneus]